MIEDFRIAVHSSHNRTHRRRGIDCRHRDNCAMPAPPGPVAHMQTGRELPPNQRARATVDSITTDRTREELMASSRSDPFDSPAPPLAVTAGGVMTVMVAFAALVVAGVAAAGLFPATDGATEAARDRGVWMATQAWANPVGLASLGVLFGVAIPLAVRNVRQAIDYRRSAMVAALPHLVKGANR